MIYYKKEQIKLLKLKFKNKKDVIFSMLLATLEASLLGNLFTGKGFYRTRQGMYRTGQGLKKN